MTLDDVLAATPAAVDATTESPAVPRPVACSGTIETSSTEDRAPTGEYNKPTTGEYRKATTGEYRRSRRPSQEAAESSSEGGGGPPTPREEDDSWRRHLARDQPFLPSPRRDTPARPEARRRDPSRETRNRTPARAVPATVPPATPSVAGESAPRQTKRGSASLLGGAGMSSLDTPRRLVDLGTGLPSFTSLFSDLRPIAEQPGGTTVLYVHVPSSAIVEERFGWEALEAYRGLIANYLAGYAQDRRRDRQHCLVARAFADDFVLVMAQRDGDEQLPSMLADLMTRHLLAVDEETAALLQVYVGMAAGKPFVKVHPERFLYRLIQQAQTEATDVGRQKISAHVRVLDRCIASKLFNMVYQPIVRMDDHSIFAYEALVRCPQKELRSPHVLFNVAEQGERIWPLSRLLRRMALDMVPQLPDPSLMFVNLHPRDFDDPEILLPDGPIARNASRVVLEVTERAAILDLDHFRQKLSALREFGAKIAVDDLGSGYSALNLVAELNPDFIKLDMTLIRGVDASPVRQNLLRNMVAFATDLGAEVVAEGVETRPELETLRDLSCQLVQGYYLAVPSPPFVTVIKEPPAQARADRP